MKVLVVDCAETANMAFVFELSTELILAPDIDVGFCKRREDAVDRALSFQPSIIIFTGKPRRAKGARLVDALHDLVPGALMLYLDEDQLYLHAKTLAAPSVQQPDWRGAIPVAALNDFATAVAVSAVAYA